jgi:hypothetical protein
VLSLGVRAYCAPFSPTPIGLASRSSQLINELSGFFEVRACA